MKKRIVAVSLACAVLAISGFLIVRSVSSNNEHQYSIGPGPIFDINADDVTRIEVANGTTGERVQVEDRDEIARIVEDMNNMQYSKKETFELTSGWGLMISLFGNNIHLRFLPRGSERLEMGEWMYTLLSPSPFDEAFYARYFD